MRLQQITITMALALLLLAIPRSGQARDAERHRGLDLSLSSGFTGCTDQFCATYDPAAYFRIGVIYRIVPYFAVGAHMGFQFFKPDDRARPWADFGWSTILGPEIRGILPVGPMEAWLGCTLSYTRLQFEMENDRQGEIDVEWGNSFAVGFGFGVRYFVHPSFAMGLDAWIYKGFFKKWCAKDDDSDSTVKSCWELSDAEQTAIGFIFTAGANLTVFLPL